jgi:hypothetical protein
MHDLVQEAKLDTSFVDNLIIHHYDDSDDEGHTRSKQRVEYWQWISILAKGGCGEVWLQKCVQGRSSYELRAVKVIATNSEEMKRINYASEIEAIAKFSQKRVSFAFPRGLLFFYQLTPSRRLAVL